MARLAEDGDTPTSTNAAVAFGSSSGKKTPWLWLALLVAVLWFAALISLALFTSNPVKINREQVLRSAYVVTATVKDKNSGTVEVSREWLAEKQLPNKPITNLKETIVEQGGTYLVPLLATKAGSLQVTPTRLADAPPLVYPLSDEAVRQLEAILESDE